MTVGVTAPASVAGVAGLGKNIGGGNGGGSVEG